MIPLVCAVVFSVGIVREVTPLQLRKVTTDAIGMLWYAAPYVVFPCILSDMEAYRFYAQHDPQLHGDYDPDRGYTQADQ